MDLRQRIAQPDVCDLADWQVANALNKPDAALPAISQPVRTSLGIGDVMDILGLSIGSAFISKIADSPAPEAIWTLRLLERNQWDVGGASAREFINGFSADLLTADQRNTLLDRGVSIRHPSWAEFAGIEVTARTVGLARGGR